MGPCWWVFPSDIGEKRTLQESYTGLLWVIAFLWSLTLQCTSPFMWLISSGSYSSSDLLGVQTPEPLLQLFAPVVVGNSWLGSPLSVISIRSSFPDATSCCSLSILHPVNSLTASEYCLCVITSFEAKDDSSSFPGLYKKSGYWPLLQCSPLWNSGWSTCIAGMRLGLGIMQVDIFEDEVNGRTSDQV